MKRYIYYLKSLIIKFVRIKINYLNDYMQRYYNLLNNVKQFEIPTSQHELIEKIKGYKKMKKVLFVFGTRPEAIKMCPLIIKMKMQKEIECKICLTGQHKEMLKQVMDTFD